MGPVDSGIEAQKQPRKAAIAAWIGSVLEYYDFFIYGAAASLVFNKIFFDTSNPTLATLLSLATFGVAYVARPVGALVLGHWGDKHGRKPVLMFTILLMGTGTFLIGCLPTYSQVGAWAPILLVALRLVQGFSAGGEQSGANSMSLEHAPDMRRSFVTGWTMSGTQAGQIIAAGAFVPLAAMGDEAFLSWGWRVPFWASAVVIFIGWYIRRTLHETPVFVAEIEEGADTTATAKTPLQEMFSGYWFQTARVALLACANVQPTIFGLWALAYARDVQGMSATTMLLVTVVVNTVALVAIPFWTLLADRIGRKPVYITGIVVSGLMLYLYFSAIDTHNVWLIFGVGIIMQGIFYSALNGVWPAFYGEMFPTKVRVSGMAFGTQIGFAIGGFAPTIATLLAGQGKDGWMPVYLFAAGVCVLVGLIATTAKETAHKTLLQIDQEFAERDRARTVGAGAAR